MIDRVDLLLDIARANELHDSSCQRLAVVKAQRKTGAYLTPKPCDCWLSRPPGQEDTAPARDLSGDYPSPEELKWAVQYLEGLVALDEMANRARAIRFVLKDYAELQWRIRDLEK